MAGVKIVGEDEVALPEPLPAVLVETAPTWDDAWAVDTHLEVVSATRATGGQDLDVCHLRRRYGKVMDPGGDALETQTPLEYGGYWVRLSLVGRKGKAVIWVGQVSSEDRVVHGRADAASGIQAWVAYGPGQILRKQSVTQSVWRDPVNGEDVSLEWVPDFNAEHRGRPAGNRSTESPAWLEAFGTGGRWTRRQAVQYILTNYANQYDADGARVGPLWTLSGDLAALDKSDECMPLAETQTVAEALAALIPQAMGIDYYIEPTTDGFAVVVYSLSAKAISFAGTALPANAHPFRLRASKMPAAVSVQVVRTHDHRYSRIRLIGERIVVCKSYSVEDGTLEARWSDARETLYKDGAGAAKGVADHERVRKEDYLADVFQAFGLAEGIHPLAPCLDGEGGVKASSGYHGNAQTFVRETLPWLPMFAGRDYCVAGATDFAPDDAILGLIRPLVWLWNAVAQKYELADTVHVGVSALRTDWGFRLAATPNHLLASGDWADARPDLDHPVYDWRATVATLAFRSDYRLALQYDVPGATDQSTLVIHCPGAELWYIHAGTHIRRSDQGTWMDVAEANVVARSDAPHLARIMAGAIARYARPRGRAEVQFAGLAPYGSLLGAILTTVEEAGGDAQAIEAPVTSVDWRFQPVPMTIVKAGFAR